jgi:hypothetical protein
MAEQGTKIWRRSMLLRQGHPTSEGVEIRGPRHVSLERDDFSSNRDPALAFCQSMILPGAADDVIHVR